MKKLKELLKTFFFPTKTLVSNGIEGSHTIKVEGDDFEGKFMAIRDCPIARAIKRQFPHFEDLTVGSTSFHFGNKLKLYEGTISYDASIKAMRRAKDEVASRKEYGNFEFETEIKLVRD